MRDTTSNVPKFWRTVNTTGLYSTTAPVESASGGHTVSEFMIGSFLLNTCHMRMCHKHKARWSGPKGGLRVASFGILTRGLNEHIVRRLDNPQ